jgi:hypothetical protein
VKTNKFVRFQQLVVWNFLCMSSFVSLSNEFFVLCFLFVYCLLFIIYFAPDYRHFERFHD